MTDIAPQVCLTFFVLANHFVIIQFSLQAENVYGEVLYSLLHAISRTGSDNGSIDQVFGYLQKAFQFNQDRHDELLAIVRQRTVRIDIHLLFNYN